MLMLPLLLLLLGLTLLIVLFCCDICFHSEAETSDCEELSQHDVSPSHSNVFHSVL